MEFRYKLSKKKRKLTRSKASLTAMTQPAAGANGIR
jgi:hypothetical protein